MKLSTRSTYALRAVMELAAHYNEHVIMVREIAERQNLPATYLEQLMVQLRKAGVVTATRGAGGGYRLARSPWEITVLDVVEAFEGPLELVDCTGIPNCCITPAACALKDVFDAGSAAVAQVFAGITLANLLERQRAKTAEPALMYSI